MSPSTDRSGPAPLGEAWVVRIEDSDSQHVVDVEVAFDSTGASFVVVGVAVRARTETARSEEEVPRLPRGGSPVSGREVRRLPLSAYTRAALALMDGDPFGALDDLALPRGRPSRGRSTQFYSELLAVHRDLLKQGNSRPVREIARRKNVTENLVHQWLYRARRLEEAAKASQREEG